MGSGEGGLEELVELSWSRALRSRTRAYNAVIRTWRVFQAATRAALASADTVLQRRPSTQVWAAVCGNTKSLNYPKGQVGGRLNVYEATDCKKLWALHFSLVNAAATDGTVHGIATGYFQCRANLVWL